MGGGGTQPGFCRQAIRQIEGEKGLPGPREDYVRAGEPNPAIADVPRVTTTIPWSTGLMECCEPGSYSTQWAVWKAQHALLQNLTVHSLNA
jgi:hypothetical protein